MRFSPCLLTLVEDHISQALNPSSPSTWEKCKELPEQNPHLQAPSTQCRRKKCLSGRKWHQQPCCRHGCQDTAVTTTTTPPHPESSLRQREREPTRPGLQSPLSLGVVAWAGSGPLPVCAPGPSALLDDPKSKQRSHCMLPFQAGCFQPSLPGICVSSNGETRVSGPKILSGRLQKEEASHSKAPSIR